MKKFTARLHVLLAREARSGVVIRRGPSKSVAVLGWDRRTDTFQLGQWLRGRIYERRCDLSPDGKWFIYFAMNGRWDSEAKGAWTAVSRAPWLKAVTLLAKGDCWHGGGLFTCDNSYWLNDGHGHQPLREDSRLKRDTKFIPMEYYGGECTGVYYLRLQRDGWSLIRKESFGEFNETSIFEKSLPGGWTLRKRAHEQVGTPPGKGCYWDEHELEHRGSGAKIDAKSWEWAELDGKRLVWTDAGCLWAGYLRARGLCDTRRLHDFNAMEFESIVAPY